MNLDVKLYSLNEYIKYAEDSLYYDHPVLKLKCNADVIAPERERVSEFQCDADLYFDSKYNHFYISSTWMGNTISLGTVHCNIAYNNIRISSNSFTYYKSSSGTEKYYRTGRYTVSSKLHGDYSYEIAKIKGQSSYKINTNGNYKEKTLESFYTQNCKCNIEYIRYTEKFTVGNGTLVESLLSTNRIVCSMTRRVKSKTTVLTVKQRDLNPITVVLDCEPCIFELLNPVVYFNAIVDSELGSIPDFIDILKHILEEFSTNLYTSYNPETMIKEFENAE